MRAPSPRPTTNDDGERDFNGEVSLPVTSHKLDIPRSYQSYSMAKNDWNDWLLPLGIVGALGIGYYLYTNPTVLAITTPSADYTTIDSFATVAGVTDTGATVKVNGVEVVGPNFYTVVELYVGDNVITVTATNGFGTTTVTRIVTRYIPSGEPPPDLPPCGPPYPCPI